MSEQRSADQCVHEYQRIDNTGQRACLWCGAREVLSSKPTADEIVSALREYNYWLAGPNNEDESSLVASAADEIERLRALLRECLEAWEGTGPAIELDRIRGALS